MPFWIPNVFSFLVRHSSIFSMLFILSRNRLLVLLIPFFSLLLPNLLSSAFISTCQCPFPLFCYFLQFFFKKCLIRMTFIFLIKIIVIKTQINEFSSEFSFGHNRFWYVMLSVSIILFSFIITILTSILTIF